MVNFTWIPRVIRELCLVGILCSSEPAMHSWLKIKLKAEWLLCEANRKCPSSFEHTGLHFQKVYTHSGTSCPQWGSAENIAPKTLELRETRKVVMHEQTTKGVGKMNICMGRFGTRIGDRKYLNEYTPFGSVSLWTGEYHKEECAHSQTNRQTNGRTGATMLPLRDWKSCEQHLIAHF